MGVLTKSDLKYVYSWTSYDNDNPKITGSLDSTLLNRNEGYEILYFINKYCDKYRIVYRSDALKIERMIKTVVPNDIHSQQKIEEWIFYYWNKY